jgi:hypothetical protein
LTAPLELFNRLSALAKPRMWGFRRVTPTERTQFLEYIQAEDDVPMWDISDFFWEPCRFGHKLGLIFPTSYFQRGKLVKALRDYYPSSNYFFVRIDDPIRAAIAARGFVEKLGDHWMKYLALYLDYMSMKAAEKTNGHRRGLKLQAIRAIYDQCGKRERDFSLVAHEFGKGRKLSKRKRAYHKYRSLLDARKERQIIKSMW